MGSKSFVAEKTAVAQTVRSILLDAREQGDFADLAAVLFLLADLPVGPRRRAIAFAAAALSLPKPTRSKLERILAALKS